MRDVSWTLGAVVLVSACGGGGGAGDADADSDSDSDSDGDSDSDTGSESGVATGCGGTDVFELELRSLGVRVAMADAPPLAGGTVVIDCAAGRTEGTPDAQGRVRFTEIDYATDAPDVTFWAQDHTVETIFDLGGAGRSVPRPFLWSLDAFEGAIVTFEVALTRSQVGTAVAGSFNGIPDATYGPTTRALVQSGFDPLRYVGLEYEAPDDSNKRLISFSDTTIEKGGSPALVFPADYGPFETFDVDVSYELDPLGPLAEIATRRAVDSGAFYGATVVGWTVDGRQEGIFGLTEASTATAAGESFQVAYADEATGGDYGLQVVARSTVAPAISMAFASLPLDGSEDVTLSDPPMLGADPATPIDVTSEEIAVQGAEWANLRVVVAQDGTNFWRFYLPVERSTFSFPQPPAGAEWGDALPSVRAFQLEAQGWEYASDPWASGAFGGGESPPLLRYSADQEWSGIVP